MATEKNLYAQEVIICQKYLDNKKARKNTNNITSKGSLKDQYDGSILIMGGSKKYLSTHKPDFYKKI